MASSISSNTFNSDCIGDSSHSSSETVKITCGWAPVRVTDSNPESILILAYSTCRWSMPV